MYCTVLYCIVLYCIILYYIILYYIILYYIILYYIILYYIILYCLSSDKKKNKLNYEDETVEENEENVCNRDKVFDEPEETLQKQNRTKIKNLGVEFCIRLMSHPMNL